MKTIVVLSGAGISKESGIPTFRDNDGLWKTYKFEEVASLYAWKQNPQLVLDFYNYRRKTVIQAKPNRAHLAIKELESKFDIKIITQNVDDLHERAGSSNILHLHGEIRKARSTGNENHIVDIRGDELNIGDTCPQGYQLRPHIVWFGEEVKEMGKAIDIVKTADIFLVIGTGLKVYPAAGLLDYIPTKTHKFIIDPDGNISSAYGFKHIKETAINGIIIFVNEIKKLL